jgi:hypothetical protein
VRAPEQYRQRTTAEIVADVVARPIRLDFAELGRFDPLTQLVAFAVAAKGQP